MKKKSSASFLPENSAQINCCRNPNCNNYLQPAEHPYVRVARGVKSKNKKYRRIGNQAGVVLKCLCCGETFPIKSANALEDEKTRLKEQPKIDIKPAGCRNKGCDHFGIPISNGKAYYSKFGTNRAGNPRYKCKACGKTFAINTRPNIHQIKPHANSLVFRALVNKSPLQRIAELAGIDSKTVMDKIDFVYRQCVLFSRHKELKLPDILQDKKLRLSTDAQSHLINWTWRKDKRNTQLLSIATACNDTGFVLASHLNYDPDVDQEDVEAIVSKNSEALEEPAFRETARFWTQADYLKSINRARSRGGSNFGISETQSEILRTYLQSESRLNIDDSFEMDEFLKTPDHGVQIHSEYTMLAHFKIISELTRDAKKINHYMDQDSGIRAAFMLGYRDWLSDKNQKRVDGFYVKFSKDLTVDEKQRLRREYESFLNDYRADHNNIDELNAKLSLIQENISSALELGKWKDRWVGHPVSSMNEPEKMICHLNDLGQHSPLKQAWMYLNASLHGIDRFFMQSRRMVSYLERPIQSASNSGNMWNGYNAYNPESIVKAIEIFRVYYNYCKKGDDGMTPAQRIGLSKGINGVEDILYFHPHANLMRSL